MEFIATLILALLVFAGYTASSLNYKNDIEKGRAIYIKEKEYRCKASP